MLHVNDVVEWVNADIPSTAADGSFDVDLAAGAKVLAGAAIRDPVERTDLRSIWKPMSLDGVCS
jgi:hypothetical protein